MSADMIRLRDYQNECVDKVIAAWLTNTQRPAVVLPTGCHRAGQRVLMYDGSVCAVENVRAGDRLMGPDSTPREVLSLARGTGPMMEVRPVKGRPWVVNDEHVLTLVRTAAGGKYPSEQGGVITDVALPDWWQWARYRKHTHKIFRVPVDFPAQPVPDLDPYFLGVVLGDGSLSVRHRLSIATADQEITELCEQVAQDHGRRGGGNPLVTKIRALGLCPIACADRFVPEIYKLGSRKVRLETLAGLIDSDGALSGDGYDFGSKSERLADDVAFMARSLGLAAYVTKRPRGHYRVSVSGDCTVIPVRIRRKKAPARTAVKDVLRTGFDVIPTGTVEPYYGFHLDGDHRYLLDDFTVTHNSGKTVIFSHLADDWLNHRGRGTRVVILVHRDELADQAIRKLHDVAPHMSVGKVKAADNDVHADVMVCSVQTLARQSRLDRLISSQYAFSPPGEPAPLERPIGLVIVDECHHAAAPSYRRIMEQLGCFTLEPENAYGHCAGTRAVGFTATLARGDGVGLGSVWDSVAYTRTTLEMIRDGFLTDVKGRNVDLDFDLSGVKTSAGDYQAKSLGEAIVSADGPRKIAAAVLEYAEDRRPIVFTPDVASAYLTAAELDKLGILCDVVEGNTSREERQLIYKKYRTGELQAVVNCMVLTEGADFPWADCAVIARPTRSAPLYIQMVGRVLRPWPGKSDALVLNVIGQGGTISTLIDLDPGLVTTPRPGESLADAYTRQEERADSKVPAGSLAFELKYRDMDLFAASSQAWLRTPGGVMFLPLGQGEVFLWPDAEGTWAVCFAPTQGRKWVRLHRELPLGLAMAWAETEAGAAVFALSAKDKRWRKEKADAKQIGKARSMGIDVGPDPRKGSVSDAISTVLASWKFDERVKKVQV